MKLMHNTDIHLTSIKLEFERDPTTSTTIFTTEVWFFDVSIEIR